MAIEAAQLVSVFKADASQADKEYDRMAKKTQEQQGFFDSLLGKIGSFAGMGAAFFGIQAGLGGISTVLGSLFAQDEGIENTTANLTRLLGSTQAAQQAIANMQQFAASTPLDFSSIADATQQLLGFGYQLNQTQPLIQAIGDALGANLTPASLMQVVQVFGQMHAGATLQTQDLKQLQSAGINAFQVLADNIRPTQQQLDFLTKHGLLSAADAAGVMSGKIKLTSGDIQALVTAGLIPSAQGIDTLTKGIENSPIYKGGMATASQTTAGRISTLEDNLNLAAQAASTPVFDELSGIIDRIGKAVSSKSFQDFAKTMGKDIGQALAFVFDKAGLVAGKIGDFVGFLQTHEDAMVVFKSLLLATGIVIAATLVPSFIAWAISAGAAAIATFLAAAPVILITLGIAALIAIIWLLVANWDTVWKAITKFGTDAWHAIVDGWNHVIDFFTKTIPDAVTSGFKWAINKAIDFLNFLIDKINHFGFDLPGGGHFGVHINLIPHLAKGGTLLTSGDVLVGEKGPEVLRLPAGAQVRPLQEDERSTRGGNTYNIVVNDANVDERKLVAILKRQELLHR